MRESIGTVSLLNFVMFFILLVFAFLAGTMSYYKAYRVNNFMVAAIEKFEGFNYLSYGEIEEKLNSFGYQRIDYECPETVNKNKLQGVLVKPVDSQRNTIDYSGYCVYRYGNDTVAPSHGDVKELATTDIYDTYEVRTFVTFQFPIVQNILKLRVSSRTGRIYRFQ